MKIEEGVVELIKKKCKSSLILLYLFESLQISIMSNKLETKQRWEFPGIELVKFEHCHLVNFSSDF